MAEIKIVKAKYYRFYFQDGNEIITDIYDRPHASKNHDNWQNNYLQGVPDTFSAAIRLLVKLS